MPKKTGHNCAGCSKLSNTEAQAKPCWDGQRCPNRRHYQRNKQRISQERKVSRVVRLENDEPEGLRQRPRTIAINPPIGVAASIIFYRERRDAPVHAIAAEVWQGGKKVLSVQPMHCVGLSSKQVVEELMPNILQSCSSELGVEITKFAHRIELHPSQCPITPCPLCPSN